MLIAKNLLNKPNPALVMMPRIGKLTVTARKMYNVLLKKTQQEVMEIKRQGRVVEAEHLFSSPIKDLVTQIVDVGSKSDLRTAAKKYLREMRRVEVDWEAPDANTGVVWSSMGLLSEAQLEIRSGVMWVRWGLPPTLLASVSDPERFTTLDLDEIAKLDTYAAIALYEICRRYRGNPTHVTSRNATDWWTDALSNTAPAIDKISGAVVRREWRKFKSEIVGKAVLEINEKTDLTVALLEHKGSANGREAQFSVHRKKASLEGLPQIPREVAEMAVRADINLEFIAKLVSEGVGENDLRLALTKLMARSNVSDLGSIENRPAYLRRLLNEAAYVLPKFQIVNPASSQAKDRGTTPPEAITPEQERRTTMKKLFLELSDSNQQVWVNLAAKAMEQNGMLTPSLSRRVKENQWRSGVLLSKAIYAFAEGTVGPDWLNVDRDNL